MEKERVPKQAWPKADERPWFSCISEDFKPAPEKSRGRKTAPVFIYGVCFAAGCGARRKAPGRPVWNEHEARRQVTRMVPAFLSICRKSPLHDSNIATGCPVMRQ